MDLLSDEILGEICSHLDFKSANLLGNGVSVHLAQVFRRQKHLWDSFHQRLGFANDLGWNGNEDADDGATAVTALRKETIQRYQYSQMLSPKHGSRTNLFCIPARAWFFLPVEHEFTDLIDNDAEDDDSLVWTCEDCVSLLGGTSPQLVVSNPWTNQVTLANLLDELEPVDFGASFDMISESKGGSANGGVPDTEQLKERRNTETTAIKAVEVLLDSSPDAFDLADYFDPIQYPDIQVEVTSLGLEARSRLDAANRTVMGSDVSCVRLIESTNLATPVRITEVCSWFLKQGATKTSEKRSIRFVGSSFWAMAVCGKRQLIYTNAFAGFAGASSILIYPMLPELSHQTRDDRPRPVGELLVGQQVNAIEICPSSHRIVIATLNDNSLQVWNVDVVKEPFREESISIEASLSRIGKIFKASAPFLDRIKRTPVYQVFVAKHMTIQVGGLVTLHFDRFSHCSMLVWKHSSPAGSKEMSSSYEIASIID